MIEREIHLRFEWLAARCTVPGVLDADRLRALGTRFQPRSVRHGLLERLLRRLAMFADASGEAMIWRMPRYVDGAPAMEVQLPAAQADAVVAQTIAPGVMIMRETIGRGRLVESERAATGGNAVTLASAAAFGRAMPSTLAFERRALLSVPVRRVDQVPATLAYSKASLPGTRSQSSAASRPAVGVANSSAAAPTMTNVNELVSTHVTFERALSDAMAFGARLNARYGISPGEPAVAPIAMPTSARATGNIVLREPAIPSDQRGSSEMPARKAMEVTSLDSIRMEPRSSTAPPLLTRAQEHWADSAVQDTTPGLRRLVTNAAAAVEHKSDSPSRPPLLLRKAVAAKSSEPARVASSAHDAPRPIPADARPMDSNAAIATPRPSASPIASHRIDTIQFDALLERLVARLELEARRQGRYRWR